MKNNRNGNYVIQWIVVFADFLLMNLLLALFFIPLNRFLPIPHIFISSTKWVFLIANVSMLISEYFFHTIIHLRIISTWQVVRRIACLSVCQGAVFFILVRIMSNSGGLFRALIYYTIALFVILLLSRIIELSILHRYRRFGGNIKTVVFVGNDPANLAMYKELNRDPSTGYRIQGYFSDGTIEDAPKDFKKLGTMGDLDKIMDEGMYANHLCDEIFCSISHSDSKRIVKIMKFCDQNIIHFYYVPRQFGNYRLMLKTERVGNIDVLTNYKEPLTDPFNKFIKRTFDVIFSFVVCICLLPLIPIIALIIKAQSPGPVFFKQMRTGINGEPFLCYKFRSMHINANADTKQATENDPRKFAFGNFMRKTNIDELPQFFNVLKGDMSIVGPRPHMLYHTELYSKLIDKYMVRHFSKPGITGWAQVTGYRGETKELWQMEERVRRDIWYIENWTFWLDIKIIFMTIAGFVKPDKAAY